MIEIRYRRCRELSQLIRFLTLCERSGAQVSEIITQFRRTEDGSKPGVVFDVAYRRTGGRLMGRRRNRVSIPDPHPGQWTTSWFMQHTEWLWNKHLLPLAGQIKSYVEIGLAEGRSMTWIMENLKPERAIGIDPYLPDKPEHKPNFDAYYDRMRENLKPWLDSGVLTVHKQRSIDFLRDHHREIPDGSVDLCYLDGSHMAWDLMTDVGLIWPKLKRPGGILLWDDVQKTIHLGRSLTLISVWAFEMTYFNRYERFFKEGRQFAVRRLK